MTTRRQKQLARLRVENPKASDTELIKQTHAESTAIHCPGRTMNATGVQDEIKRLMAGSGVQDQDVFNKLKSLMDAQTVAGKDCVSVPDNRVQLSTSELFLKMRGFLKDDRDATQVIVVVWQQLSPLIAPYIMPDKRDELMAVLEQKGLNGSTGT